MYSTNNLTRNLLLVAILNLFLQASLQLDQESLQGRGLLRWDPSGPKDDCWSWRVWLYPCQLCQWLQQASSIHTHSRYNSGVLLVRLAHWLWGWNFFARKIIINFAAEMFYLPMWAFRSLSLSHQLRICLPCGMGCKVIYNHELVTILCSMQRSAHIWLELNWNW